jgi:ABC-2 type transport system permease protein
MADFFAFIWKFLLFSIPGVICLAIFTAIMAVPLIMYPNARAIFKREFFSYFNSPVAYVILVIFLFAALGMAFLFGRFLDSNNASLTQSFFVFHPWIYFVLAPAVGMRLWSEEQRLGTLELLMTMPISPWHAIIGKFIAAAAVWLVALVLTVPIVITVTYLGDPDPGPVWTGYVASYCYALGCLAITSAVSAFTRSQVVCFIVSVALCFLLTIIGWQPVKDGMLKFFPDFLHWAVSGVAYTCFTDHFYQMTKGILQLEDIVYFASVVVLSLIVTHAAIKAKSA